MHDEQAFKAGNYPDWMITILNTRSGTRVSKESDYMKKTRTAVRL